MRAATPARTIQGTEPWWARRGRTGVETDVVSPRRKGASVGGRLDGRNTNGARCRGGSGEWVSVWGRQEARGGGGVTGRAGHAGDGTSGRGGVVCGKAAAQASGVSISNVCHTGRAVGHGGGSKTRMADVFIVASLP